MLITNSSPIFGWAVCWLICALRSVMMPCSGQGVGEPVQLTDGPAHSLSRQFKGQHVYQLFMSVLTNSINHNININTSIISATFNEWSSHDTPLGTSEETESTKVMTQKTSPLDKIVRKLSGLSPTEAENIHELSRMKWILSPEPRLFSCLSRIFRKMGVKCLVHVQKSHSEPQI